MRIEVFGRDRSIMNKGIPRVSDKNSNQQNIKEVFLSNVTTLCYIRVLAVFISLVAFCDQPTDH